MDPDGCELPHQVTILADFAKKGALFWQGANGWISG